MSIYPGVLTVGTFDRAIINYFFYFYKQPPIENTTEELYMKLSYHKHNNQFTIYAGIFCKYSLQETVIKT